MDDEYLQQALAHYHGLLGPRTKFTTISQWDLFAPEAKGRIPTKNCLLGLSFISASSQDQLR